MSVHSCNFEVMTKNDKKSGIVLTTYIINFNLDFF